MKRAVIVGMGFGGLKAARALAGKGVEVLVIDRRNFHLFQPLLYQVATAAIEQEYIAYPSRAVLRKCKGVNFRLGEVTGVDFDNRIVRLADGEVPYDYLVLAAGSATHYFGMKSMEEHSFDLKSLDQTVRLRNHILNSFELASCEPDPAKRRALLSFVVIGGGPAGVEFAGSLQELIQHELIKDYPDLDESDTKIVLIEARGSILPFLPEKQRDYAVRKLSRMGVEVSLNTQVSGAEGEKVLLANGSHIPAHTIVWTAGVQAAAIAAALELPKGAGGRIAVEPDLTIAGRPEVFVVGDIAYLPQNGVPLPMVAQVAMQGGEYAGKAILSKIKGQPVAPFKYFDKGNMAIIGRNAAAVNAFGVFRFKGFFAWFAWLALHLYYLTGFRNRTMVGISWVLNYFFRSQQVRVISASTAKEERVLLKQPEVATNTKAV
ncbi:MAG: NAD(P)/FAD-dependent oxidoreductase [Deltaproteobacteria bacterium]|nr:NAD(P)/FAD-dependent oxidoreductase [Deltaproteobacteria bacterium]